MSEQVVVRVFTHPVCATCPNAIRIASEVAESRSDVALRIVSLATEKGRAEAQAEQVLSVPTVLVGEEQVTRFVGVPDRRELNVAIDESGGGL